MQTVVNEARDERLVAPKKLGISLLDERDPEFFFVLTLSEDQRLVCFEAGEAVVDDHVAPGEFLEKAEDVDILCPKLVEYGGIHTLTELFRHVPVDNHAWMDQ